MELTTLWFGLVVFFWTGYLALEGFDFGVGILARLRGRTDEQRGLMLGTIGPHWDANEVWMVMAIGSMFAAFPGWYARFLSTNYLIVLGIIVALIVRGIALEYRGKGDSVRWRQGCDLAVLVGSVVPPFGWGVLLAGSAISGVVLLGLCLLHGWAFLRLKDGRGGWPFMSTTIVIVVLVPVTFVLRHSLNELNGLASSEYGLTVMTWASIGILPFVVAYQGWSYWVLRKRLAA